MQAKSLRRFRGPGTVDHCAFWLRRIFVRQWRRMCCETSGSGARYSGWTASISTIAAYYHRQQPGSEEPHEKLQREGQMSPGTRPDRRAMGQVVEDTAGIVARMQVSPRVICARALFCKSRAPAIESRMSATCPRNPGRILCAGRQAVEFYCRGNRRFLRGAAELIWVG